VGSISQHADLVTEHQGSRRPCLHQIGRAAPVSSVCGRASGRRAGRTP
jgi:hypothetical protein